MNEKTGRSQLTVDGAVLVMTGAGGGIGEAIAESFARRGARVVVSDIEAEAAERVAGQIRAAGGAAIAQRTDVTSLKSLQELADLAYSSYGRVDILCNNAGVTLRPFRAVWEASAEDFEWMMRVNYFGVVNGLLAFLPRMRQQSGRRHIINTSSMTTLAALPGHAMYTASKAAVDALSELLREELVDHGDDIGVTVVHPSNVPTRISTSERLRAPEARSAQREVTPYPYRRVRPVKSDPLDAALVGEMVLAAVEAGAPYCLTHEADLSHLAERAKAQAASFGLVSKGLSNDQARLRTTGGTDG